MKHLMITISSSEGNEEDFDVAEAIKETINNLVTALQERSVTVYAVMQSKIKFYPSTIMREDVEYLVNELEYSYMKIPNVTYPTKILSDNGKDEEYYLNALFDEQKISVIINMSAGLITVSKD